MAVSRVKTSSILQGFPKSRSLLAGNAAYIPTSFESIATATGTGASGTITFSSIPSTYKHLQLRWNARSTFNGQVTSMSLQFNGSATAAYGRHTLTGNTAGTFQAGGNAASQTSLAIGTVPANTGLANAMAVGRLDISDYALTTNNKVVRIFNGFNTNGSSQDDCQFISGLWVNTSAITSITLTVNTAFATTAQFSLYGITG